MPMNNEEQRTSNPMVEMITQVAEAGAVRKVDVGAERAKPTFMGQEEFADKLSKYTLKDYLYTHDPYFDLLECSRAQPGLFEQFAAVLMDSAKAQMFARDNSFYEAHVAKEIALLREAYLPDLTEAANILDFINRVENDPDTGDRVSVLPLMCGSGKSTAITKKIIEVIKRNEDQTGYGMLLVTDSVKRLNEIWNSETENPLLSDEEKQFIKDHQKDVSILTAETYSDTISRQKYSPVLCMTTQRYFYVLTKDEIKEFLKWSDEGKEYRRSLIVFDEEPFLNEVCDLTPKTVNDIDTMLWMVLDDNPSTQEDKHWCLTQWNAFRIKFLNKLWEYEHNYNGWMFYHEDADHCLTEDDGRFFSIIMRNRSRIRTDSTEVFKSLFAVKAFVDTWGIYSHRSGSEYESKFTVYVDNSDKVKDLDAKVIVLDGTGDVSPMYAGLDYIDMRNGMGFVRSLAHLTVRLGDINTSKAKLGEFSSSVPKAIISYLDSIGYNKENTVIFTYKQHENKFRPAYKKRTEHFGNIKGINDYSNECCIAQVGLNQMQPVHYLTHMLARHEELRSSLVGLSEEESWRQIDTILRDTNNCGEVMTSHVLADIDQNMFRSAIRTVKNRRDVVYYVFYTDRQAPELRKAIRDRYCTTLGAHLESVNENTITEAARAADTSAAGKLLRWYESWNGEPTKKKEICRQSGISSDEFKKLTKERNEKLKELFGSAKEKALQNGYKNGWYMK